MTGIYRQGWKEVDDAERVHINKRMEDFTGCKFVGNRMFLNALSGTLYVKAANTESKPCDIGTNKREMDCPEYVRWVFEPVYRLTFKNGTLVSREELICCDGVDFEQDDLSVEDVVIYQKVDAPPVFLNEMKAIENKEIKDLLDAEALRIVNAMPRWEPARDNKGKKFDSGAELIIDFRLQKNKVPVAVVDESDFGCKYHVTIWQEPRKMKNHGDDILKP